MTVKELIHKLESLPPDAIVKVQGERDPKPAIICVHMYDTNEVVIF